MLSLKQLKKIESQPTLFDAPIITETISNEDAYEVDDDGPKTDWYIPKKSWKQFFAERESGIVTNGWVIPVFDTELPKEIRLNPWTRVRDVKNFVSTHLEIIKKYNGNKKFEQYLKRLEKLKTLL